jgi:hypothetical protein
MIPSSLFGYFALSDSQPLQLGSSLFVFALHIYNFLVFTIFIYFHCDIHEPY